MKIFLSSRKALEACGLVTGGDKRTPEGSLSPSCMRVLNLFGPRGLYKGKITVGLVSSRSVTTGASRLEKADPSDGNLVS